MIFARYDGGYCRSENLQLLTKDQLFCTKVGAKLKGKQEELKKATRHYWKRVDKHTKIFDCGFINLFPNISQKYRLILVKGQKIKERRIPKNQRKQGKGHRSYRITYQEVIFGILTNLSSNPIHVYKFYKQRHLM